MRVHELIRQLDEFDYDLDVEIGTPDGTLTDIKEIKKIGINAIIIEVE